jgi:hypothetical protein
MSVGGPGRAALIRFIEPRSYPFTRRKGHAEEWCLVEGRLRIHNQKYICSLHGIAYMFLFWWNLFWSHPFRFWHFEAQYIEAFLSCRVPFKPLATVGPVEVQSDT